MKPRSMSSLAISIDSGLSRSLTEKKTLPSVGSGLKAEIWALAYAMPRSSSMPMTSPVDFISGPRTMSIPGNLGHGNTASFTQ